MARALLGLVVAANALRPPANSRPKLTRRGADLYGGENEERNKNIAGHGVDSAVTNRVDAAAATWIFCGDESRRRRGHDADILSYDS